MATKKTATRRKKTVSLKPLHNHFGRKIAELKRKKHPKPVHPDAKARNQQIDETIALLQTAQSKLCGRGGMCGPDMAIPYA